MLTDITKSLETLIFETESGLKTFSRNASNVDMDEVEGGNGNKTVTPRPRGSNMSESKPANEEISELSNDEEPYVTPFPLEKKKRKVFEPPPGDTDSEIEQQLRGKAVSKKAGAASNNLKVR